MAPELLADPEITQALKESEDALWAERRMLGPLQGETTRLQARLEHLKAERDQLRGVLERLREGRARNSPRLPEVLVHPFKVRPRKPLRRHLRELLPYLGVLTFLSIFMNEGIAKWMLLLALWGTLLVNGIRFWRRSPWWHFSEAGIEGGGKEAGEGRVPYSSITGVKVEATPSQRRRRVGTVQVAYEGELGGAAERNLTIEDVPEPERLASWIESKRSPRLGVSE
jgi:hypothetical protein